MPFTSLAHLLGVSCFIVHCVRLVSKISDDDDDDDDV